MMITGTDNIQALRMLTLWRGLKLEIDAKIETGCYKALKRMGYTGSRKTVFKQLSIQLGKE